MRAGAPEPVAWEVVAARRAEVDVRAPSGYVGTVTAAAAHLWVPEQPAGQ